MKTVLFTALLSLVAIFTSFAQAQNIPLIVDSAQSSFSVTLNGSSSSSQLSGTTTIDIQSTNPPSGVVQITDLNVVVDDGLSFSLPLFLGATTVPGGITLSLVTPGPAGSISGNSFDQLSNLLELGGDISVSGLFFNQTIDLSTIDLAPANFNSVTVTQSGSNITVSGSLSVREMTEFGLLEVDSTFAATGVVPDMVLLGDVNMDGIVGFSDIPPFIELLISGDFQAEADIDLSGEVDFSDIPEFIAILIAQQ